MMFGPDEIQKNIPNYFSSSYQQARERFRNSAAEKGFQTQEYRVPSKSNLDLTIDTVSFENPAKDSQINKTVVISSGIHGVEGYFGSAVQQMVLDGFSNSLPEGARVVLIHCLNPYGFAMNRRFDEENIDLNRNFLLPNEKYKGVSENYLKLNRFLNPLGGTTREWFYLKAIGIILRMGMPALRQAVAGGQYEFAEGIFFGGFGPSASFRVVQENLHGWIGNSSTVIHFDMHTGLGKFGDYRLLLAEEEFLNHKDFYENTFGPEKLDPLTSDSETAYKISGLFGTWVQDQFPDIDYRFMGAEFGTYNPVRVMRSIRNENRSFHYDPPESSARRVATKELIECFCPESTAWREKVLNSSYQLVTNALNS